ncbi:TetR/AcrR family transcriptional regulator [Wenyingzhuangia sp. IMCC45533]
MRQHIITTASNLFYNNGYNLTGINEIIAEAGIAKATLYNHFKSKEDICVAYLQHKNNTFLKDIHSFCNTKSKGLDRLTALFEFLDLFFEDKDFNGCWCIRTVSEIPKDNQKIKAEIQKQKTDFIALIAQLVSENTQDYTQEEVEKLAKQYYLLYETAVAESHLHQENWPIAFAKKMSLSLIN